MDKKVPGALFLLGVLIICIHLGSESAIFSDLDIDFEFNLKVSTKADQVTET